MPLAPLAVAVEPGIEPHLGAAHHLQVGLHLHAGIGPRVRPRDDDVAQALLDPGLQVVADAPVRLPGGADAHDHEEGPSAPPGDGVADAAHLAVQVGEGVTQSPGVLLGQVEGVALPVELDAVPVGQLAGLGDAPQGVLPDLGHRHVPRRGRPGRRPFAEDPLRVALAEGRQVGPLRRRHLFWLQRWGAARLVGPEVVVVHADRGIHAEAQLAAPAHEPAVQVDSVVEHRPQALRPAHVADGEVAAPLRLADHRTAAPRASGPPRPPRTTTGRRPGSPPGARRSAPADRRRRWGPRRS